MKELQQTFPNGLPPGARLFSVDAIGMYSNIDTNHGIDVLTRWLRDYRDDLPKCMPVDFIIEALTKIMRSNIFQFGDTYWKQTQGCTMGTSAAVNYAYLYAGLLEVQRLLPRFKTCLPFFKRFINDGIGVWLPHMRVLFNDTRQLQSFDYHPFFHSVPYACVQEKTRESTLCGTSMFGKRDSRVTNYQRRRRESTLHTSTELTRV
jgi:hypothetical protein